MTYADYEWFLKTDFSRYAGKWIAIVNKTVAAVGAEPTDVLREAKKSFPKKKPLLTKIKNKLSILNC